MHSITEPGIYPDMPAEVYHADPAPDGSLSSTWARKLMEPAGPAKFIHERRNPPPPKKVFEFGQAAHTLVLGVGQQLVEIPDNLLSTDGGVRSKEAKAWAQEARERGEVPLKPVEYQQVHDMAAALQQHREANDLLTSEGTQTELSTFRIDPETGMWLRCRFDAVSPEGVIDYKTIVDADPGKFARDTAHRLGYHQQDAWYRDQAKELGITVGPLRFILQEKTAPYLVSVVHLDDDYLDIGRRRNRTAIELFAKCLATDEWPGYTGTRIVGPPKWLVDADDEELSNDIADEIAAYAASLSERSAA